MARVCTCVSRVVKQQPVIQPLTFYESIKGKGDHIKINRLSHNGSSR